MVTLKIRTNATRLVVLFVVMSPVISKRCSGLALNYKDILHLEISNDFFELTIVRYMREIGTDSSLVHLIIEGKSATTDNFAGKIVEKFSEFGIPRMLLLPDKSNEEVIGAATPDFCQPHQMCSKFRRVIGVFENIATVQPEKWKMLYRKIWYPGAYFMILIKGGWVNRSSVEQLLTNFWSLDCANVVIAFLDRSGNHSMGRIWAYDPFVTSLSKGAKFKVKRGIAYPVKRDNLLFPEKLKNLHNYGINTSLYRHRPHARFISTPTSFESATGLDVEVLRYAAEWLNFTVYLKTGDTEAASYVVRLPNGQSVGAIGDIITGRSEYLANGQFLEALYLYNRSVDFVYPYWRSQSVVVVRRSSPTPAIIRWIKAVGGEEEEGTGGRARHRYQGYLVVLAFGIGLLAMAMYLWISKKQSGGEMLLAIIGLILFQHLPNIGRSISERIFCFTWIYASFVVCNIYQGNLVNDLTSPPIFDDIDTLKELVDRTESLRLMVRPYERRILGRWAAVAKEDPIRRKLFEGAVVQLNFSACLAQMRESRNVACSIDQSYGKYALSQVRRYELLLQKNPDTNVIGHARAYLIPPIHILDESLMDFWKTYFVRRGFPYLRVINEAISRAVEFGLVDKWLRDDKDTHFKEPQASNEPRSLGLSHMDYTFAILIIGHVLATAAFIGEIIVARARRRR